MKNIRIIVILFCVILFLISVSVIQPDVKAESSISLDPTISIMFDAPLRLADWSNNTFVVTSLFTIGRPPTFAVVSVATSEIELIQTPDIVSTSPVYWLEYSSDGTYLLVSNSYGPISLWEAKSLDHQHLMNYFSNAVDVGIVSWSGDNQVVVMQVIDDTNEPPRFYFVDISSGELVNPTLTSLLVHPVDNANSADRTQEDSDTVRVSWHPLDSNTILVAARSSRVDHGAVLQLWDFETNEQIGTIPMASLVYNFEWSSDGKYVAAAVCGGYTYEPCNLQIWSSGANEVSNLFGEIGVGHIFYTGTTIDWHPSQDYLAVAEDKVVSIWDVQSQERIVTSDVFEDDVTAVAWSSDGTMLVAVTNGGAFQIWDVN